MSRRGRSSGGGRAQRALHLETVEEWEVSGSLVEHWCAGDEDVVDAVFKTYGAKFTRRLRKKFGWLFAEDQCEEMVSIAVGRAWLHREQFLPEAGALEAWLWTITYRMAAEVKRKGWCKERCHETALPPEKLVLIVTPVIAAADYDSDGEPAVDVAALVELAMTVLREDERVIISADMHSPSGTATSGPLGRQLGLAPSTIRWHRARGRKKLKAELRRLGWRAGG